MIIATISEHAIRRCQVRHGFRPTRVEADLAVFAITEGRSDLIEVQPNGRELHRVALGPCMTVVVYEPAQACIVTVLGDLLERRDPLWGKRIWRDREGRPRW